MKRLVVIFSVFFFLAFFLFSFGKKTAVKADYPLEAVPLTQVDITDQFWAPKQEINRTVSLPYCIKKSEEAGRGISSQYIEGAAYIIAKRRDPAFEAYIKEKVDKMLERTAGPVSTKAGPNLAMRAGGTSAEAAIAYFQATGDRRLLDGAIKAADAADATYGPGKGGYISGHEGQKIGLIRLYRQTADERYWKLAKFLLDIRGRGLYDGEGGPTYEDKTYAQNHLPVVEQSEAVGHCVRAMYLYIPLTDIAALTGQPEYAAAADRLWENVVSKKLYVTGSIGAVCKQEKFGVAYQLPNVSAYGETCAAYGNVVWNRRLFLLHRDAKYIDIMERVLYNGFLDAISLKGDRFFYQNPLMSYGNYERLAWFNVPCCPPNIVRLMASIGDYVYAQSGNEVYVNLFVAGKATVKLEETNVQIKQETRYPWDGRVKMAIDPERSARFAILVRIPEWAQNRPLPSDLYKYLESSNERPSLKLNGETVEIKTEKGYVRMEKRWKPGDTLELDLPMTVHKVLAHPNVQDDIGRVALERGPLVYCAEWPDNGGSVSNLLVPDETKFAAEFRPDLLNGVEVIMGGVSALVRGEDGVSVQTKPHRLVAIPFYAWANRGMGEMTVWLARRAEKARLKPAPPDPVLRVTAFGGIENSFKGYNRVNDVGAVYDGMEPMHSMDESYTYYLMAPPAGRPAWIEYELRSPTEVSSAEVYFVDDQRFCFLPKSWRILYRDENTWKPVKNIGVYGVERDKFNKVTFEPVKTGAIRLEVEPQTIINKAKGVEGFGPPDPTWINIEDRPWREFGIIEWRVK